MRWNELVENSLWDYVDGNNVKKGITIRKSKHMSSNKKIDVFGIYVDGQYLGKAHSLDSAKLLGNTYFTRIIDGGD